jgi:hypothetical protein
MKTKLFLFSIVVIISTILTSCTGPEGKAYQKYWWAGSLGYFYDTNPSTPYTIYNNVYFSTNAGNYYLEYRAFDGSAWYMYYTITINKGGPLFIPGDDVWFEIDLYSFGPSLYKWDSAKQLTQNITKNEKEKGSENITNVKTPYSENRNKTAILGSEERKYSFGTIQIKYGKILP